MVRRGCLAIQPLRDFFANWVVELSCMSLEIGEIVNWSGGAFVSSACGSDSSTLPSDR